jgi:hypothetical protein
LQGNIPFHGKKQYDELIMSMLAKAQDIEQDTSNHQNQEDENNSNNLKIK